MRVLLLTLDLDGGERRAAIDGWLELARRGLFGFDWQHWSDPCRRAATPNIPVVVAALPKQLQRLIRLIEWPAIGFAEIESVRPEELCPCG